MTLRERMERELVANNGAILIWQSAFNTVDWEWMIDNGWARLDSDWDLLVHPDAIRHDDECAGYYLPAKGNQP